MSLAQNEEAPLGAEAALELRRRARRGVIVLVVRTAVLQLTVLGGMVLLARLLEPEDFGAFAVIQFVLQFFTLFGDAGFGAALIQRQGMPSARELSSVFVFQTLVSVALAVVVFLAAGAILRVWPALPATAPLVLQSLSIVLVLTTVRVIPTILMERELHFGRLAFVEVAQQVAFYATAIPLAWLGLGIQALAYAAVAQALIGALGAFALRPWRPRAVFDRELLRPILRFGVAFQVKSLVGFANGAVTPLYAGAALGAKALGFIGWAQTTAWFPLKLVEIMQRVSFPLFSRLRGDREQFARSLESAIQICAVGTLFMVGLFFGAAPSIVHVIYTDKWLPALPLLYIFAGAISIGFLSPIVAAAMDALGKPRVFALFAVGWTTLNWLVVPVTTYYFGTVGFVAGYCVHVVAGNLAILWVVRTLIPDAHLWPRLRAALAGAVVVGVAGKTLLSAETGLGLVGLVATLLALFAATMLLLDRRMLRDAMATFRPSAVRGTP